jgi:hypothetical protein
MTGCLFCLRTACIETGYETSAIQVANDNVDPADRIINMPSDEILKCPSVYHRLAIVYKALGIKRRDLAEWVNQRLWNFAGEAFDSKAIYIDLLLIDAHDLLWPDSDPGARLVDDFYAVADAIPKQKTQDRVLPRIRLLWLALATVCPKLAAKVIR